MNSFISIAQGYIERKNNEQQNKKRYSTRKKTLDDHIRDLKEYNSNLEYVDGFKNMRSKALYRCKKHNEIFSVNSYQAVHRNAGCSQCSKERYGKALRRTKDEYEAELAEKNPVIELRGDYINNNTKTLHYCNKHNIEFEIAPYSALEGAGCIMCASEHKSQAALKTEEQYKQDLAIKNPTLELFGNYINDRTKIAHRCKKHNVIWDITPNNALGGEGCYLCKKEKMSQNIALSHQEYVEKVAIVNPYIKIRSNYIKGDLPIEVECEICHYIWFPIAKDVARGKGCPKCNEPLGERYIRHYLEDKNILYYKSHSFNDLLGVNNGLLTYDFYLPQYRTLIEFQGVQHYQPVNFFGGDAYYPIQKEHDSRKEKYAVCHGYNYLVLSYKDINDIDNILDAFLNDLKLETVETTGIA